MNSLCDIKKVVFFSIEISQVCFSEPGHLLKWMFFFFECPHRANSISIITSSAQLSLTSPHQNLPVFILESCCDILTEQQVAAPLANCSPAPGMGGSAGEGWLGFGGKGAAPVSLSLPRRQRRVKTTRSSCERWGLRIISNSCRQLVASSCPDSCHDVVIVSRLANRKRRAAPGGQVKRRPNGLSLSFKTLLMSYCLSVTHWLHSPTLSHRSSLNPAPCRLWRSLDFDLPCFFFLFVFLCVKPFVYVRLGWLKPQRVASQFGYFGWFYDRKACICVCSLNICSQMDIHWKVALIVERLWRGFRESGFPLVVSTHSLGAAVPGCAGLSFSISPSFPLIPVSSSSSSCSPFPL